MEDIQKLEQQLIQIRELFESSYEVYYSSKKEYDKKSCELKNLYIIFNIEKKKKELEEFKLEKKEIENLRMRYKEIIKVIVKTEHRGRPKKREVVDKCGIEVLMMGSEKTSLKSIRDYCKKNKIKYYTKLKKNEMIEALLKI